MCLAMTRGSVTVTVCWGLCPCCSWASLSHCSLTTSGRSRELDTSGNSTETCSPGTALYRHGLHLTKLFHKHTFLVENDTCSAPGLVPSAAISSAGPIIELFYNLTVFIFQLY